MKRGCEKGKARKDINVHMLAQCWEQRSQKNRHIKVPVPSCRGHQHRCSWWLTWVIQNFAASTNTFSVLLTMTNFISLFPSLSLALALSFFLFVFLSLYRLMLCISCHTCCCFSHHFSPHWVSIAQGRVFSLFLAFTTDEWALRFLVLFNSW